MESYFTRYSIVNGREGCEISRGRVCKMSRFDGAIPFVLFANNVRWKSRENLPGESEEAVVRGISNFVSRKRYPRAV